MHSCKGDTIDIAFKSSKYPTPYGDNNISGSTSGHRERHLGRSHAPNPINYSQLSHALIAPYSAELVNSETSAMLDNGASKNGIDSKSYLTYECRHGSSPYETHRVHACRNNLLNADRYILNVKRAGKRHFDELQSVESRWIPSLRVLDPPSLLSPQKADACVQHRKPGLYNYDRVCRKATIDSNDNNTNCNKNNNNTNVDIAIKEALRERERRADPTRHGKAHVCGPPDHNIYELGMCDLMRVRVESSVNKPIKTLETEKVHQSKEENNDNSVMLQAKTDEPSEQSKHTTCATSGWVFESASKDESNGIAKAAYESTRRPDDDEVKYIRATQEFNAALRLQERRRREEQSNAEDIEAVKQLPLFDKETNVKLSKTHKK